MPQGARLAASPLLTTPDTSWHSRTMGQAQQPHSPQAGGALSPQEAANHGLPLPGPQLRAPAPHPNQGSLGAQLPGLPTPMPLGQVPCGTSGPAFYVYVRLGCAHPEH